MGREMTSRERFQLMFEHREADRVPIIDGPWDSTIERWNREGMPVGIDFVDYFGMDHVITIAVDNSPQYEQKVLQDTEEEKIYTTQWGVTLKQRSHLDSTPDFLNFTIIDPDSWRKARERMKPEKDRVDWDYLKRNYHIWKKRGYWLQALFWFGFDATHSWAVGTERLLMALIEKPDWCVDMFNTFLDLDLALYDMVWEAGYNFDSVYWCDDMGYKNNQFFSVDMYRDLLKPVHKRAIDWAHQKGIKAHLHSCGNVNPFVPELIELGLDALNPLEVKAGMDPVELKMKYGNDLVFHGGINAVLWDKPDQIEEEICRVLPVMKESGGYIFSSDHSVPHSVSLKDFQRIVELVKKLGSYA